MRISTLTMYEQSTTSLNRQQSSFLKIQQQIASGRRVVNPSDDPLAMAKASAISQSASVNKQFADARISARNSLSQEESVLNSVGDAITSARTLLVQAMNGTLTDADRAAIGSELEGIYSTLVGQANAADGNGRYLFGGYQDNSAPFTTNADGSITYVGDEGVVAQQVDSARQMPSTDNGLDIFMRVHNSAAMVARAGADNAGSVRFTSLTIENSSDPDYRQPFDVTFSDVGGVSQYSVNGGPATEYVSGEKLSVNGMGLVLTGTPVAGDTIQVGAGQDSQTDIFASLRDAIDVLKNPVIGEAGTAKLRNTLNSVTNELTNSLDNVLTIRASVGARINELDIIDSVSDNRALNYESSISKLLDLDYNQAMSEYSLKMIGLQAAQKTFVDVQKLSLFNHI